MSALLEAALRRGRAKRELPPPAIRRAIRRSAGITQADVAAYLGVDRPSVTRYEAGLRDPRGETLVRYVALLELLAEEARK